MSSIIKSSFISLSEQKKTIEVIKSNDAKIINPNFDIQHHQDEIDDGFQINRDLYRSDTNDDTSEERYDEQYEEDQFEEQNDNSGLPPKTVIEDAVKQAEEILEGAKETAASIEAEANTKGYDEGFKAGKKQALKEELKLKQKLKEEIEAVAQDRKNAIHKMQPKVAEIIQKLVRNMIGIQKYDPEIILFLIKLGLEEVDLYGDLIIKVSPDDYDEVIHNKDKIIENLSDKLRFEILKDNKMNKNDCIIETSLGSINCSLNERMDGLLRQLELIEKSYSSNTPID